MHVLYGVEPNLYQLKLMKLINLKRKSNLGILNRKLIMG